MIEHKIRQAMIQRDCIYTLGGTVEMDEFLKEASNHWMINDQKATIKQSSG